MKILVVDDEKSIRLSLRIELQKLGIDVITAETGEEGLEMLTVEGPDLAIVDIKLPGIDGIEFLTRAKQLRPSCIVMMITYLSDVNIAVKAMKMGAYDYFTKPFSLADISNTISKILDYAKLKKELDNMEIEHGGSLIGNSESIQKIKEYAKEIGAMNFHTRILLQGESGTGKEVVARFIHWVKCGRTKPFIAINCAAIPATLQESELFGYEKGAFTDAKSSKVGLIEKANQGVLFLDEIADMDLSLQAKLLRVLQEKRFLKIGGVEEMEFDATIIAATNKNLKEEIAQGHFRQDLYYRLNIIPLHIPPLRHRKEDIPLLLQYYINEYNIKLNKKITTISDEVLQTLKQYHWTGNVRELKNIIERIMIFKKGNKIDMEDLPDEVIEVEDEDQHLVHYYDLETMEKEVIKKALGKNQWQIAKTAGELGITRQTLRKKIQRYDIINDS